MIHTTIIILSLTIIVSCGEFKHNKRLINQYLNNRQLLSDNSEEEGPLILTVSEKGDFLDQHNYYRSQTALGLQTGYNNELLPAAYDMNELLWDNGLEQLATDVASTCDYEHSTNNERISFLQSNNDKSFKLNSNSFIGESSSYFFPLYEDGSSRPIIIGQYWVDGFAGESQYWKPNGYIGTCMQGSCGHFAQIINSQTKYVGCGFYYCPNGMTHNGRIISSTSSGVYKGVCNYMVGYSSTTFVYGKSPACEYDRNYNEATGLCEPITTTTTPPPTTTTLSPTMLHVRTLTGGIFSFDFDSEYTIQFVKDQIEDKYAIPAEQQRLIFQGQQLEDMNTLNDYNIQQGSILYLVLRLRSMI